MKAVAVDPGKANSIYLAALTMPSVDDISGGRGVLVKMAHSEVPYPGWLGRLLTYLVDGLGNFKARIRLLTEEKAAIMVHVKVSQHD